MLLAAQRHALVALGGSLHNLASMMAEVDGTRQSDFRTSAAYLLCIRRLDGRWIEQKSNKIPCIYVAK